MARMTSDERRINYMCKAIGFEPEEVYALTKMMLIEYKKGRDTLDFSWRDKTPTEIRAEKRSRRTEFLEIMSCFLIFRLPMMKRQKLWESGNQHLITESVKLLNCLGSKCGATV